MLKQPHSQLSSGNSGSFNSTSSPQHSVRRKLATKTTPYLVQLQTVYNLSKSYQRHFPRASASPIHLQTCPFFTVVTCPRTDRDSSARLLFTAKPNISTNLSANEALSGEIYADEEGESSFAIFVDSPHTSQISAMSLECSNYPVICCVTASRGFISIWMLNSHIQMPSTLNPSKTPPAPVRSCRVREFPDPAMKVDFISIHPSHSFVALACEELLFCLDVDNWSWLCFKGHVGKIPVCAWMGDLLFSISHDRTFKVWSPEPQALVYQSCILSSSPLTAIAVDAASSLLVLGQEDGELRFFDLGYLSSAPSRIIEPREFRRIYLASLLRKAGFTADEGSMNQKESDVKIISSQASWRHSFSALSLSDPSVDGEDGGVYHSIESSPSISALHLFTSNSGQLYLIIGCLNEIIIIHARTFNVTFYSSDKQTADFFPCHEYSFSASHDIPNAIIITGKNSFSGNTFSCIAIQEIDPFPPPSRTFASLPDMIKTLVSEHVHGVWAQKIEEEVLALLKSLGVSSLNQDISPEQEAVLRANPRVPKYVVSALIAPAFLTFIAPSNATLFPSSPLKARNPQNAPVKRITVSKATSRASPSNKASVKGTRLDQPVTFRSKVKSSGYLAPPAMATLFQPNTSKKATSKSSHSSTKKKVPVSVFESEYFSDIQKTVASGEILPIQRLVSSSSCAHSGPITSMAIHPNGGKVVSVSADKSMMLHSLPLKQKSKVKDFLGHDFGISRVSWSSCGDGASVQNYLLTTSGSCVRIWDAERTDQPLLLLNRNGGQENKPFAGDVKPSQFYYQDRFILVPCGDTLSMFDYHLVRPDPSNIQPMLMNASTATLRHAIRVPSKSITAIAALNTRLSHLVLIGLSDKSLSVHDLNAQSEVWTVPDAHARPIYAITLHDSVHAPASHLLATSSFGGGDGDAALKCWDIRMPPGHAAVVCHLSNHVNRVVPLGAGLSPDGLCLAVGSEDHHVYVYDLRKGVMSWRVGGGLGGGGGAHHHYHSDTVSVVAWHPLRRALVTGCVDGRVRFFEP